VPGASGTSTAPDQNSGVRSPCCTKTFVESEPVTSPEDKTPVDQDLRCAAWLTIEPACHGALGTGEDHTVWVACQVLPPTDLLNVLQRLTI
jgi:hypothetical protein